MHLERVSHAGESSISALFSDRSIADVQLELRLIEVIGLVGLSLGLRDGIKGRRRL